MNHCRRRSFVCILYLVVCITIITAVGLSGKAGAQTVSSPISRHTVIYSAFRYTVAWYQYPPGSGIWHQSIPYSLGYGDSIDDIGQGTSGCNRGSNWIQRRLNNGCVPGTTAGADCSGYVTRVWGRPISEKWGTWNIADRSIHVSYDTKETDLPNRMRMGDVFDDYAGSNTHVVLLYYFDPETGQPRYYEEVDGYGKARLNEGGWSYLKQYYGWWNGADGYRPYRYRYNTSPGDNRYIQDDLYLPDLRHAWYNWESTLFVRDNASSGRQRVLQHTTYRNPGGDTNAYRNQTRIDTSGRDLWTVPTADVAPNRYVGGGVVAADTGTAAAVYVRGKNQTMMYTGVYPFSSLGLQANHTLYMPFFLFQNHGTTRSFSKIYVQNAGKVATNITATYYGDDGRTCIDTRTGVSPWGMRIFDVDACPWGGTPPTGGTVRLNAAQPLAATTAQFYPRPARRSAYNAFAQGSTQLYAPNLFRNFYGWHTTLHLQNLGGGTAHVDVNYYAHDGDWICRDIRSIPAYRHQAIDHGGTTCVTGHNTFVARISANREIAAVVNQEHTGGGDLQSYNAFIAGRTRLILPYVRQGGNWAADILVQNTTNYDDVEVTVKFYEEGGSYAGFASCTLNARGACTLYGQIPNYIGSASIEADRPVAAVVNMFNSLYADGAMGYSAVEKKTSWIMGSE